VRSFLDKHSFKKICFNFIRSLFLNESQVSYYIGTALGGGGAGKPVPVGGKFVCEFSIPDVFGCGGGDWYSEAGVGSGMLKPVPARLVAMSSRTR